MRDMKRIDWIYLTVIALGYILYGIIQFYNGVANIWSWKILQLGILIGGAYVPNAFPDAFSGIVLITVGGLFLKAQYLKNKKYQGYLFVACSLAILLMLLNVLVILANILDAYYPLLWGETVEEGWVLAQDSWGIGPHIILGILLSPYYPATIELWKELKPKPL